MMKHTFPFYFTDQASPMICMSYQRSYNILPANHFTMDV